jgi:hypothetical protein
MESFTMLARQLAFVMLAAIAGAPATQSRPDPESQAMVAALVADTAEPNDEGFGRLVRQRAAVLKGLVAKIETIPEDAEELGSPGAARAIEAVGLLRAPEAADALARRIAIHWDSGRSMPAGGSGRDAVTRVGATMNQPCAYALVQIGYPALLPVLRRYLATGKAQSVTLTVIVDTFQNDCDMARTWLQRQVLEARYDRERSARHASLVDALEKLAQRIEQEKAKYQQPTGTQPSR